ncbi:MAG: hypothetical protein Q9195_006441 [Heterodermia aff. obscurata]
MQSNSGNDFWGSISDRLKTILQEGIYYSQYLYHYSGQSSSQKDTSQPRPIFPLFGPNIPHRDAVLCNGDPSCPDCTVFYHKRFLKIDKNGLKICRPYLWTMDISHLCMMLEMRLARLEEEPSNEKDSGPRMSVLEMHKVIAYDTEAVLAHTKISKEDFEQLPGFLDGLEEVMWRMDFAEGSWMGEGLEDVIDKLHGCKLEGEWGVFEAGSG